MRILEIGGGEHPQSSSTVRVDIRAIPGKVDVVCNAISMPMFPDNEFDKIYARHVIEHWSFRETDTLLKEWRRVLKSGGELEVHCPDLDKLVQNYLNRTFDGYTGRNFTMSLFSYYVYGGQEYPDNTHRTGWNFATLSAILTRCGFRNIRRYDKYEDNIEMRVGAYK